MSTSFPHRLRKLLGGSPEREWPRQPVPLHASHKPSPLTGHADGAFAPIWQARTPQKLHNEATRRTPAGTPTLWAPAMELRLFTLGSSAWPLESAHHWRLNSVSTTAVDPRTITDPRLSPISKSSLAGEFLEQGADGLHTQVTRGLAISRHNATSHASANRSRMVSQTLMQRTGVRVCSEREGLALEGKT